MAIETTLTKLNRDAERAIRLAQTTTSERLRRELLDIAAELLCLTGQGQDVTNRVDPYAEALDRTVILEASH
jgi:hypothetical protein